MEGVTPEMFKERQYLFANPEEIRVDIALRKVDNTYIVDPKGDIKEHAFFKVLTMGDFQIFEKLCNFEVSVHKKGRMQEMDFSVFRKSLLRKNLLRWSLGDIQRENGWITEKCWQSMVNVSGNIVNGLLNEFEWSFHISKDEEMKLERQSISLFAKNGRGVDNPCEGVSLFCMASGMYEKFGLSYYSSIRDMPYKDYRLIRMVSEHESQAIRRDSKTHKRSPTKIAGTRGTRESKGTSVPM